MPKTVAVTFLWLCLVNFSSGATPDFARDIQPIFAERCHSCHGAEKQKSGLRLDRKADALGGGDSGKAIQPGRGAQSLLIRHVSSLDPEQVMPPKGERLTARQIALLRDWIDGGAAWPDERSLSASHSATNRHWAWQAPQRPPLPNVKSPRWLLNPIDSFVLANLEREKMAPSPEADRVTLIRRLSLDLIGLPPTPDEVGAFVTDQRPDAYERLVDSLLASPHFGERWGRHWLDLARYADSEGYQIDRARPWAYVYRNWVLDSFNRDQPFDQFSLEQLAGDLLPNSTLEQKIAAGFHRHTLMNHEDGVDAEEFRCKAKVDRVSTTGTVWLGLTIGCAECHSHKYDPITQREFYQIYAFFNSAEEADIPAPHSFDPLNFEREKKNWDDENMRLQAALELGRQHKDPAVGEMKRELAAHKKREPKFQEARAQTFVESAKPAPTFVHIRGDFLRPGEEVQPGTPAALHPFTACASRPNRLDLAKWMVDPANPLTARVAVNHFWQHLFGRGIVATPEDFGTRGAPPSHPELLDWLALEFRQRGWSRKAMIKLIVTSAAYRQASRLHPDLHERDPHNVLLARQSRFRLESEIIRDSCLAAGGLLNLAIGGPSFRPPTTADFRKLGGAGAFHWEDTDGPEKHRRGLYVLAQRTVPYPFSATFDAAIASQSCPRRERSNTPLQALTLWNNPVFFEAAQGLGRRMLLGNGASARRKIERGFVLCLGRAPTRAEISRLEKLYRDELRAASPASAGDRTNGEAAAFTGVAQVLMNLEEFLTRE